MAGESGITLCRWTRQVCPAAVTVILTSRDEPLLVQTALAAGVSGYLLKASAQESLMANLATAMTGQRVLDERLGRTPRWRSEPEIAIESGLSPREREVLDEMLAGFGNKTIARRLCISEDTVKSHVKAIFRKLGAVTGRTQSRWHSGPHRSATRRCRSSRRPRCQQSLLPRPRVAQP